MTLPMASWPGISYCTPHEPQNLETISDKIYAHGKRGDKLAIMDVRICAADTAARY